MKETKAFLKNSNKKSKFICFDINTYNNELEHYMGTLRIKRGTKTALQSQSRICP